MIKSESIRLLQALGLNTLHYYISSDIREVLHYLAKHLKVPLSLRTERGVEFSCPFHYQIPGELLLDKVQEYINQGYTLILAPSLDVKGCRAFGCIMYENDGGVYLEYVVGEGKVRDLDLRPDKKVVYVKPGSMVAATKIPEAEILNSVYMVTKEQAWSNTPCVIEWSYYDRGVGKLNEPLIFWEVR